MNVQAQAHVLLGLLGIALIAFGALTAANRIPVFYLFPYKEEKDRQRERRLYAIGYGGMGILAFLEALDWFTVWTWVPALSASVESVLIVYLIIALLFKPYIPGYVPGDSADRAEKQNSG